MERNITVLRWLCGLICVLSTSLIKKKVVDEDAHLKLSLKEFDCASLTC